MAMKDFLPSGLKGLLLVAFLGAYMSTVSTHLNWGASYIVNDVWKWKGKSDKQVVKVSRLVTFAIMVIALIVTTQVQTISGVWEFIMECGAGLGLLLMARWFWFRITAWAEIAATVTPFVVYGILKLWLVNYWPVLGKGISDNPTSFFITVGITSLVWILISLLSNRDDSEHVDAFKEKIYPEGFTKFKGKMPFLFISWLGGISAVYSFLFLIGKIIFKEWDLASLYLVICLAGTAMFYVFAKKAGLFDREKESS